MPLNIKDMETDRLARELAAAMGESITLAVRRAISERLERAVRRRVDPRLESILAISQRCASRPDVSALSPDQIIGYDELGLPR